jgi:two-component system response regulator NreC
VEKQNAADRKIQCLLAHPHVLLREGLRRLLGDESDLEVVAEAENLTEALQRVSDHRPQVVVTDALALGLAAEELERLIQKASPLSKVVFLRVNQEHSMPQAAAGAEIGPHLNGMAQTSAEQLVGMVRSAAAEGSTPQRAPQGTSAVSEMPPLGRSSPPELAPRKQVLTTREREVLKLLAEGRTVRAAALVLGVSAKTVDAHKFNLMRKLKLHNKVDLVMSAIQMGVLKVPAN